MEFKYIFSRKLPFCRFMHSLRKNENISMWGKRIAPQQNKLLPFLPGSLLKNAVIILFFWLHNACEAHFSYISLPFLHNYDVKISRFVENVTSNDEILFLFLNSDMVPSNSTSRGFAYIWQSKWVE